ncbi:MAG TPA: hypothetical protein VJ738_08475 [Steroidobacteraceae bacterium]|nr:hypothetical protein [Steroidobacteraceae bacterium]
MRSCRRHADPVGLQQWLRIGLTFRQCHEHPPEHDGKLRIDFGLDERLVVQLIGQLLEWLFNRWHDRRHLREWWLLRDWQRWHRLGEW